VDVGETESEDTVRNVTVEAVFLRFRLTLTIPCVAETPTRAGVDTVGGQ